MVKSLYIIWKDIIGNEKMKFCEYVNELKYILYVYYYGWK